MANLTFKEVVEAANKLSPAQKMALVQTLQVPTPPRLTRESLLAEVEALHAAGAFEHVISLRNQFARPSLEQLSDDELQATIYEAATEWEAELDELATDDD